MPQIKLYTLEEYLEHPDFEHYELVAGEPVPLARLVAPMGHNLPQSRLLAALLTYVEANGMGLVSSERVLTKHDPITVRIPDIVFGAPATLRRVDDPYKDRPVWPTADLAVEVRSQGQTLKKLGEKITEYFAVGVREVWVVEWKRQTLTKYRPEGTTQTYIATDILDGGDVVPGFRYPLAKLFTLPDFG